MSLNEIPTQFATAEREPVGVLEQQNESVTNQESLRKSIDAIPEIFLILNDKRQVVYSNQALLDLLGITEEESVYGFRPGEILNCVHAYESEGGCGTTEFCRQCGAVKAILGSLGGEQTIHECRILQKDSGDAMDLRVWATPYKMDGSMFSMFVVSDISDEKRRKALERIFYHDVLNTAGGLLGFAQLLRDADSGKSELFRERIYHLANKLIEEIKGQRELSAAETNELTVHPESLQSLSVLQALTVDYIDNDLAKDKTIAIDAESQNVAFQSDRVLVNRVLGNLLKNALEASKKGETVTLSCSPDSRGVRFQVHNPGLIPRDVQLQIFQRSFSTKGSGRGLGTYSIKLLSERYLKGTVSFISTEDEGTAFTVWYPLGLE